MGRERWESEIESGEGMAREHEESMERKRDLMWEKVTSDRKLTVHL